MADFSLPFSVKLLNPLPLDFWSGPYSGVDTTTAVAAANAAIPSAIRLKGLEVILYINGITKKYWYKDGILDTDLVEMVSYLNVTAPLQYSGSTSTLSITQASATTDGYLSASDWVSFINTGDSAGGELEGTYPNPTLLNSAVTGKVLTGLNLGSGGSISATDTILQAFGKLQNVVSSLIGGVLFQGMWNASTNTPTIPAASSSNKGWYYVVSVAGSTNIDGITDWKVGDWIISDGSTWGKVDNTDSVSSVNGYIGAVSLTTADIPEVTNLYYLDSRARAAISLTTTGDSGSSTYSPSTGVLNVPTYTLIGLGGFANPMNSIGDIIYGGVAGVATRLGGNTTTARHFLTSTGSGSVATAPAYFDLFNTSNSWTATQTFTLAPVFSSMTLGSVLFAGTGGLVSQDNAKFNFNPTGFVSNAHLLLNAAGVATTAAATLQVIGAASQQIATFRNGSNTTILRIMGNETSFFRGTLTISPDADTPTISTSISAGSLAFNQSGIISTNHSTGAIGNLLSVTNGGSLTPTLNSSIQAAITTTFAPTSGIANFAYLGIVGTINQTGGANGITRGIYINPTLTAAADWRSGEFINGTNGKFLIANATGVTPLAALHIRGGSINGTDFAFHVEGSTGVAAMAITNSGIVRTRQIFVGTSTPTTGAGLTLTENSIQFNQTGSLSTTGGGGGDTSMLTLTNNLNVNTVVNRWTGGFRNITSFTAASGDWRIFNYMSDMTVNQTGTANGFVAGYGVNWGLSTVAYHLKAFYFGFTTSQGSLGSYAPNAAVTDYQYSNIVPVINASVNNQLLTGLDIAMSGSDGAFTGVTRYALRISGGAVSSTGNLAVGSTVTTNARLFVMGSGSTNATNNIISYDSVGNAIMQLGNGGLLTIANQINITTAGTNRLTADGMRLNLNNTTGAIDSNGHLTIRLDGNLTTGVHVFGSFSGTPGTSFKAINIINTYNTTAALLDTYGIFLANTYTDNSSSANTSYKGISFTSTINASGARTSIDYGFFSQPTLTSAYHYRAFHFGHVGTYSPFASVTDYVFSSIGLTIDATANSQVINGFNVSSNGLNSTFTGVQRNTIRLTGTFAPTTGNGTFNGLNVDGTINQTGGANGATRGVYVNATLTAAADWRSGEFINGTTGKFLIANAAGVTPLASLHVRGGGTVSSTFNFFVQNSAATQLFKIQDDGKVVIGDYTSTPSQGALHIYQGSTSPHAIRFHTTSSGNFALIGTEDGNSVTITSSSSYWKFAAHRLHSGAAIVAGSIISQMSLAITKTYSGMQVIGTNNDFFTATQEYALHAYVDTSVINLTGTVNGTSTMIMGSSLYSTPTIILPSIANPYVNVYLKPTINQTGTSSGTSHGILSEPVLTSAYNYKAFEFKSSAAYTPNAAIVDYTWSANTPNINASVNSQTITGLDITLSGTDGAFTGVIRSALKISGGDLYIKSGVKEDNIQAKGATYSMTSSDYIIYATANALTFTLPLISTVGVGKYYKMYNISGIGNTMTVTTSGSDTFNGGGNSLTFTNSSSYGAEGAVIIAHAKLSGKWHLQIINT